MITYNEVESLITINLAPSTNITADKHKDVEKALLDFAESQWLKGDIKEVDCTNQYIADNFDSNGIGKNERLGWAICNGYNGLTRNRTGRVSVAYGNVTPLDSNNASQFTDIGGTGLTTLQPTVYGGSKSHALSVAEMPPHKHGFKIYDANDLNWNAQGSGSVYNYPTGTDDNVGGSSYLNYTDVKVTGGTGSTSEGNAAVTPVVAAHNNMQPYIVTLFIQKL